MNCPECTAFGECYMGCRKAQPVVEPSKRRGRPRIHLAPRAEIRIRLTAVERAALERIAIENGQTLTAFIREAVQEAVADCTDETVLIPAAS